MNCRQDMKGQLWPKNANRRNAIFEGRLDRKGLFLVTPGTPYPFFEDIFSLGSKQSVRRIAGWMDHLPYFIPPEYAISRFPTRKVVLAALRQFAPKIFHPDRLLSHLLPGYPLYGWPNTVDLVCPTWKRIRGSNREP